ncbi:ribonuclease-III-like-domain-containing protein [Aspergillus granulosus]|uniref:Ribonuclease-III-like-domain-containing protein n=1 Tax=Aspergillus granulosus TaxID=176169 RepID=A0ABR4H378_9EURO
MASLLPTRAVRSVACSACRSFTPSAPAKLAFPLVRRNYSTPAEDSIDYTDKPRWSYTPPRTKAPFSLHYDSKRPDFPVNNDPEKLNKFYIRFLGPDGDKVLSDEVKWLAVTHKSFDQGRRGFNDRLAFLGKRIVMLQASLALVQSPANTTHPVTPDPYGREPFTHPALDGLSNLSVPTQQYLTSKQHLAKLAQEYELHEVLRWSPRKPHNLQTSGLALVLAHTMYALVGAISLEKGNKVANQVARERILAPLGFKLA